MMLSNKKKEIIIFSEEKICWTFINVNSFFKLLNDNGVDYLELSEIDESIIVEDYNYKLEDTYKSISLFEVCLYNICNELQIFKNEVCIDKHSEVIAKWYTLAKKTIDYLELIFKNYTVKGTIVFHGHLMFEACLLALSKLNQVKFLSLENTSNKDRIVWDNLSGYVVNYNLGKNYFFRDSKLISKIQVDKYCEDFKSNIHDLKRSEHSSNEMNKDLPFSNGYVLFIGQVYNDASQLFALKDEFNNPIDIIKTAQLITENLGLKFILKLHPKEVSSQDPVTRKNYREPSYSRLIDLTKNENIFIDRNNDLNTFKLIENSLAVITVNSQAGLESCLYNKPVFTYSRCFYSGLGFTYDYENENELKNNLKYIVENNKLTNKNYADAKLFFYIFFEIYCIKRTHIDLFNKVADVLNLKLVNNRNNNLVKNIYIKLLNRTKYYLKIIFK